jgi:polar amino acid transport system substrate-binding protein
MSKQFKLSVFVMVLLSLVLSACGSQTNDDALRVVTDATFPPFEMVDEATKELTGFDVELIQAIAEKADMNIELINIGFDPMLAGIAECQYDIAIAAITVTEERAAQMLFTNPYTNAGQIVSVQVDNETINGKDDLVGLSVGAQLGTTGAIEAEKIEGITLKTYDAYELAFLDLINGQIDAVIADYPTALAFVGKNSDKLKTVGNIFTDESYAIAVCDEKQELADQINAALAELIADGTVKELELKWFAE